MTCDPSSSTGLFACRMSRTSRYRVRPLAYAVTREARKGLGTRLPLSVFVGEGGGGKETGAHKWNMWRRGGNQARRGREPG